MILTFELSSDQVQRLRLEQYRNGESLSHTMLRLAGLVPDPKLVRELCPADGVACAQEECRGDRCETKIHKLCRDDAERLRSIMLAAADEIEEHWEAHLDVDGAGPVNLVRRLRTGTGDYRGT